MFSVPAIHSREIVRLSSIIYRAKSDVRTPWPPGARTTMHNYYYKRSHFTSLVLFDRPKQSTVWFPRREWIFSTLRTFVRDMEFKQKIAYVVFGWDLKAKFSVKTLIQLSEAATETIFENICSFFQEHLFLYFSRRLNVFTEQMPIFQEHLFSHRFSRSSSFFGYRTDTDFPGTIF